LNFWCFIKCLITFFNFSSNNVFSYIVLFSQSKGLSDMTSSLWSKSSWSFSISKTSNFLWTFFNNFKSNNCKIWTTDASSDWLSFSFSSSSWSVQSCSYIINDFNNLIIFNEILSLINFNYFTLLIKDYYYFCYKLF